MEKPFYSYNITTSLGRANYNVMAEDGEQLFHACNMHEAVRKPSLTLYSGDDTTGSVVGVARNLQSSQTVEFYLGDPGDPYQPNKNIAWETMVSRGSMADSYAWQMDLGNGQVQQVTWKEKSRNKYHLTKDNTEQVLAVFSSGGRFTGKKDRLEVFADYGERLNDMVLLTMLALREKQRRGALSGGSFGVGNTPSGMGGLGWILQP